MKTFCKTSLIIFIILIGTIIPQKDGVSQSSFVGMTQFRMQIEESNVTLIGIVATFKDEQTCKETIRGFTHSFIEGNARANVTGKVDAILCANDTPPNTVWDALMYENSFSHYVLEIGGSGRIMIIEDNIRREKSLCEVFLNQMLIGKKVKGQCLPPSK